MPTFPQTLDQQEFKDYTQAWATLAGSSDAKALQAAFGLPDVLLSYGVLTGPNAVALVADPNTTQVKTRFVLLPVTGGGDAFAVAVYGLDAADNITTPYYVAALPDPQFLDFNSIIPDPVAQGWLDNWQALFATPDDLTQALFATEYGPLRGFNYPADDFSGPLEPLEPGDELIAELRVYYALHPDEPTDFGLVMCLGSATDQPLPARLPVVYYDNGGIVPPGN